MPYFIPMGVLVSLRAPQVVNCFTFDRNRISINTVLYLRQLLQVVLPPHARRRQMYDHIVLSKVWQTVFAHHLFPQISKKIERGPWKEVTLTWPTGDDRNPTDKQNPGGCKHNEAVTSSKLQPCALRILLYLMIDREENNTLHWLLHWLQRSREVVGVRIVIRFNECI